MFRVLLDTSDIQSVHLLLTKYVCCYTAAPLDRPALLLGCKEQEGILRIT